MKFVVHKGDVEETKSDVLIVFHFQKLKKPVGALARLDKMMKGFLSGVLVDERFTGKAGENLLIHTHHKIPVSRILVLGLGERKDTTTEQIRVAAGRAVQAAKVVKAKKVAVSFEGLSTTLPATDIAQAFVEGMRLGAYQFHKYKGKETQNELAHLVETVQVLVADAATGRYVQQGIDMGQLYSAATILARDLVNEPAVHMRPKVLAQEAEKLGKTRGITTKTYNEAAIKKLKMGSFLSVAAGSDEEPYLIHLSYKPRVTKGKKPKKLVLCGKGITFDSGGISLKPTGYIEEMKMDMAGAAVVLGIFSQITALAPNVELHGVIAATENMPSGKATRPGDVVTAYNGKTIEITNTDAEGRLILADAMAWAEDTIKPDYMIDIATLTGACMVALGMDMAGIFTKNETLRKAVLNAGKVAGEPMWELPVYDPYLKLITESSIADIMNSGKSRYGGAIEGALFLQEFVKKTPWLHMDIAGPAFAMSPMQSYIPQGATGFGVRSLLQLLQQL